MVKLYINTVLGFFLKYVIGVGVGFVFSIILALMSIDLNNAVDSNDHSNLTIALMLALFMTAGLIPFIRYFYQYAIMGYVTKNFFKDFNIKTNFFIYIIWLIPYMIFAFVVNCEVLEAGYEGIGVIRSIIAMIYAPYSMFFLLTKNAFIGYILTILFIGTIIFLSIFFGLRKYKKLKAGIGI